MMEFIGGLSIGILSIISLEIITGVTMAVGVGDAQRAEIMCKNGEWVKINEDTIYCLDGAEYPRYEEKK